MKATRQDWTKRIFGIPALAGVCLLHGCGLIGTPRDSGSQTIPVDDAEPTDTTTVVDATSPLMLPAVPLTTPYTVGKGDTLTVIAQQYGLRWQDVAAVNPGLNPNKLRIGQVIQLPGQVNVADKKPVARHAAVAAAAPAAAGKVVSYTVQKGDSISVIAQRFGVKVAAIKEANNLTSDVIRVGQKLKIVNPAKTPAATGAAVKAPAIKAPAVVPVAAPPVPRPPVVEESPAVLAPPAPDPMLAPDAAAPAPVPVQKTATAVPETFRLYTVKEGEDLYTVAIRWGVSPNEIKTLNGLTGNDLEPGKTIKIPQDKQP